MTERAAAEMETVEEVSFDSTESQPIDPNREDYDLAATEYTIKLNPYPHAKKPIILTHVVRRPTFEEEERKERMTPLITKSAGKVQDAQASKTDVNLVPGDNFLYEKILKRAYGYPRKAGEKPTEEGIGPQEMVDGLNEDGQVQEMPLVAAIPQDHKSLVVNGMYPSFFDIHKEAELESFSLVGGSEWTLRQDIGGRELRDDGTLSPPDFTILYTFKEPTQSEMRKFRTSGFATKNWTDKEGVQNEERRLILRVICELFDKILVGIEGVKVGDSPFDLKNREHLAMIPSLFKKGCIMKLFTMLQADLGK